MNRSIIIILSILSLVWGSSFILMKRGLDYFDPSHVAAWRVVFACLTLLPFALKSIKTASKSQLIWIASIGFTGSAIPAFLFSKAQTVIPSAIAGILNGLTPLFTLIIGVFFFKTIFTVNKLVGVILGLIGAALIIQSTGSTKVELSMTTLLHSGLIVLATLFYGLNTNLIKTKLSNLKPIAISSLSFFSVGPFALLYIIFSGGYSPLTTNQEAWMGLGYIALLGVLGTALALILYYKLIQISTPLTASFITYLIPIVAIGWGVVDGEPLNIFHVIGMAFILGGITIANESIQKWTKLIMSKKGSHNANT